MSVRTFVEYSSFTDDDDDDEEDEDDVVTIHFLIFAYLFLLFYWEIDRSTVHICSILQPLFK